MQSLFKKKKSSYRWAYFAVLIGSVFIFGFGSMLAISEYQKLEMVSISEAPGYQNKSFAFEYSTDKNTDFVFDTFGYVMIPDESLGNKIKVEFNTDQYMDDIVPRVKETAELRTVYFSDYRRSEINYFNQARNAFHISFEGLKQGKIYSYESLNETIIYASQEVLDKITSSNGHTLQYRQ